MMAPISQTIAALVRKAATQSSELLHSAASRSAKTYRSTATGVRGTDEVARVEHKSAHFIRWAAVGGATSIVLTQAAGVGTVAEETGTEDDPGTDPTVEGRAGEVPHDRAHDRATAPLNDQPYDDSRDRLEEDQELRDYVRELLDDSRRPAGADEQDLVTPQQPIPPDGIDRPAGGPPPPLGGGDDPTTGADSPRPSDDRSKDTRSDEGAIPAPPPGDSGNEPPPRPPSIGVPADDPYDQG
jgi:hypothetical protein